MTNTAASAPSVATASGAVQKVGLPYIQNAISAPSVRLRNTRAPTATAVSCATSRTAIAATFRTLTSKLQPESTASTPIPPASCIRTSSEMWRSSQRRAPSPKTKAPKRGSAMATPYAIAGGRALACGHAAGVLSSLRLDRNARARAVVPVVNDDLRGATRPDVRLGGRFGLGLARVLGERLGDGIEVHAPCRGARL